MADTTENEPKISIKLMVIKEENRVIFAEADNHFVDILFSFMTLPMATILRLSEKRSSEKLGSLSNVYQSLVHLSDSYMSSEECKYLMLNPKSSAYDHCRRLKINIDDTEPTKFFICQKLDCSRGTSALYSTCKAARCQCGKSLDREIKYKDLPSYNVGCSGYVDDTVFAKDLTTYIVADDLRVTPNTCSAVIELLCEHGIDDITLLDEITIDIGFEQILILLKSAYLYTCPLTCLHLASMNLVLNVGNLGQVDLAQDHPISKVMGRTSSRVTLKLFKQKSTSKLLFAEADSNFVEFLFGFLEIPLGTLVGKLMNSKSGLNCIDNLFLSISRKSVVECMKSVELKNVLLEPQLEQKYLSNCQMFPLKVSNRSQMYCYSQNGYNSAYLTHDWKTGDSYYKCCHLNLKDTRNNGKILKPCLKFMVTDDLVITPLSSTSTLSELRKLKVPLNDVEEHEVSIGTAEGLKILKSSLKSFSTLTDALLKK